MMAYYEYLRFHERITPEEAIRSYTEETTGEFQFGYMLASRTGITSLI